MSTTMLMTSNTSTASQELNDANGVNMSLSSPSMEQMNRIISYGAGANDANASPAVEEPAFGTHVREAVAIVKDWIDRK